MSSLIVFFLAYSVSGRIVSKEIQARDLNTSGYPDSFRQDRKEKFGSGSNSTAFIEDDVKNFVSRLSLRRCNTSTDVLLVNKPLLHNRWKRSKAANQQWDRGPWWSKGKKFEHGPWWKGIGANIKKNGDLSAVRKKTDEKTPLLKKNLGRLSVSKKGPRNGLYSEEVGNKLSVISVHKAGRKKAITKNKRQEKSKRREKYKTRRAHTSTKSAIGLSTRVRHFNLFTASNRGSRTLKNRTHVKNITPLTTSVKALKTQKRDARVRGINPSISSPKRLTTTTSKNVEISGNRNKKKNFGNLDRVSKKTADDELEEETEGSGDEEVLVASVKISRQESLAGKQGVADGRVKDPVVRKALKHENKMNAEYSKFAIGTTKGNTKASVEHEERQHDVEEAKKKKERAQRKKGHKGSKTGKFKSAIRNEKEDNKENKEKSSRGYSVHLKEITKLQTSSRGYLTSNQGRVTRSSGQIMKRHKKGEKAATSEVFLEGIKSETSMSPKTGENNTVNLSEGSHKYAFQDNKTATKVSVQKEEDGAYRVSNAAGQTLTSNGKLKRIKSDGMQINGRNMREKNGKQKASVIEAPEGMKEKAGDGKVGSDREQKSKSNAEKPHETKENKRLERKKTPTSSGDQTRIGGDEKIIDVRKNSVDSRDRWDTSIKTTQKLTKVKVTEEAKADYVKGSSSTVSEKRKKPMSHSDRAFGKVKETLKAENENAGSDKEQSTKPDVNRVKEDNLPKDEKTTAWASVQKLGPGSYKTLANSEKKNGEVEAAYDTSSVTRQKPVIHNKSTNGRVEEKEPHNRNSSSEKEKTFFISNESERRTDKGRNSKLNSTSSPERVKEKKEQQKEENTERGNNGKFGFGWSTGAILNTKVPDQATPRGVTRKFANVESSKAVNDRNKSSSKHMQQEKEKDLSDSDEESKVGKKGTTESGKGVKRKLLSVPDRLPKVDGRDNGQEGKRDTTSSSDRKFGYGGGIESQLTMRNDAKGLEQSTSNGAKGKASTDKSATVRIRTNGREGRRKGSKEVPSDYEASRKVEEDKNNFLDKPRTKSDGNRSSEKFEEGNKQEEESTTSAKKSGFGGGGALSNALPKGEKLAAHHETSKEAKFEKSNKMKAKTEGDGKEEGVKSTSEKEKKIVQGSDKVSKKVKGKETVENGADKERNIKADGSQSTKELENEIKSGKRTTITGGREKKVKIGRGGALLEAIAGDSKVETTQDTFNGLMMKHTNNGESVGSHTVGMQEDNRKKSSKASNEDKKKKPVSVNDKALEEALVHAREDIRQNNTTRSSQMPSLGAGREAKEGHGRSRMTSRSSEIIDIAATVRASVKSSVDRVSLKRVDALIDVLLDGKETVLHNRRKRSKAAKQHWGHGPWWSKSEKLEHGPWWNRGKNKSKIKHDISSSVRRESVEKNPALLRKSLKKLLETKKALSEDESLYSDEVGNIRFEASVRGSGRKKVVRKKKRREESKRKKQKTRRVHSTRKSNAAKRRKTRFSLPTTTVKALQTQKRKTHFKHNNFSTSSIRDIRRQSTTTVRGIPPSAASERLTIHKTNAHTHIGGTPSISVEGLRTQKREIGVKHITASTTIAKNLKTQKRNVHEKGNISSTVSFRRLRMQKRITRLENITPPKISSEIVTAAPSRYNGYQNEKQYSKHFFKANKNAVADDLQKRVEGSGNMKLVGDAAQAGKQRPAKISIGKQGLDDERVKEAVTRITSNFEEAGDKESTQPSEFARSVFGTTNGDTKALMMPKEKMHSVEEVKNKKETTVKRKPANGIILVIVKSGKNAGKKFEKEKTAGRVGQMEGFTKDETENKKNVKKSFKNYNVLLKETTTLASSHGYLTSNQRKLTRSSGQVPMRHKDGEEKGFSKKGNKSKTLLLYETGGNNISTLNEGSHNYGLRNYETATKVSVQKAEGGNYRASNAAEQMFTSNGKLKKSRSGGKQTKDKNMREENKDKKASVNEASEEMKGKADDGKAVSDKEQKSSNAGKSHKTEGDKWSKKKKISTSNNDRIRIGGDERIIEMKNNVSLRDHRDTSIKTMQEPTKGKVTEKTKADYLKKSSSTMSEKERKSNSQSERAFRKVNEIVKTENEKAGTDKKQSTKSDANRSENYKLPKDEKTTAWVSERKFGPGNYRTHTSSEKENGKGETGYDTSSVTRQKPVIGTESTKGRGEKRKSNSRKSSEKEKTLFNGDGLERRRDKGRDTKLNNASFPEEVKEDKEPQKEEDTKSGNDGKFGVVPGAIVSTKVPDKDTSKGATRRFANTVEDGKAVNDGNKLSINMQQDKEKGLLDSDEEPKAGEKLTTENGKGVRRNSLTNADRLSKVDGRDNGQEGKRDTTSSNDRKFGYDDGADSQLMMKNDANGLEPCTSNGVTKASTDKSANVRIRTIGEEGRKEESKEVPRPVNETANEGGRLRGKNNLEKERNASLDSDGAFKRSTEEGRHTKPNSVSSQKVKKDKEPQKEENTKSGSNRKSGLDADRTTVVEKASVDKDALKRVTQKSANRVENSKTLSDGNLPSSKHAQKMMEFNAGKDSTAENGQGVNQSADADPLLKKNARDRGQERKKITTSSNKRKLEYGNGAVSHMMSISESGPEQNTFAAKQNSNSSQFVKGRVRGNGKEKESEKKKDMAGSSKPFREMEEGKKATVLYAERNTYLRSNKSLQKFKGDNESRKGRTTTIDNVRKGNAVAAVVVLQPDSNKSVNGKTRGNEFEENKKIMREKEKKPLYNDEAARLKMQDRRKEDSKSVSDKEQTSKGDRASKGAASDIVLERQNSTSRKDSEFAQVGETPIARTNNEERPDKIMSNGSTQKPEDDEYARKKTGDNKKRDEKKKKKKTSSDKESKKAGKSNIKVNGANKGGNIKAHGTKTAEEFDEKIKVRKGKYTTAGSKRNTLRKGKKLKKPSNSHNSESDMTGNIQKERNNEDLNKDKKEKTTTASYKALRRVRIRGGGNVKPSSVDENSQRPRLVASRVARKGTAQSKKTKNDKNNISTGMMQSKGQKTGIKNPAEKNRTGKARINGKGLAITEKTESMQTTPVKLQVKSNGKESAHKIAIKSATKSSKGKESNENRTTRKFALKSVLKNRKTKKSNKKQTTRKGSFKRDRKLKKGRKKGSSNKLSKQNVAKGKRLKTKNRSANKPAVFKVGRRKTNKRKGKPKIERLKSSFEYEESPWKFRGPMFDD
ncbi:unnamed protein product [Cylicocyclus nassatus]|uniref:Uncharacterized protein n=1 Tax=Cylicocyclus nassatus TaxID=53992 RepID=A0AA36M6T4_CYLNA|nr:unnamed protein product [Cylicocyclus nassatus]